MNTHNKAESGAVSERPLLPEFYLFCAMVWALPIPVGLNRDWLWLSAAAFSLLLLALTLFRLSQSSSLIDARLSTRRRLAGSAVPLSCLGLIMLVCLLQLIPLPEGLLSVISPHRPTPEGWAPISVDPMATALRGLQTLFFTSLFLLAVLLVSSTDRLRTLMLTMVLAGFFQALYGSLMTLSGIEWLLLGPKEFNTGLATGTYINRNHFAGFLEMTLAVGIGLLLSQIRSDANPGEWKTRLREIIRWILGPKMRLRLCLVVMVIGLVLSHSRMGNGGFFISLLVASTAALILLSKAPRPLIILIVSLIVIDLVVVGTWFGFEQVVDRIQQTAQYDELADRHNDQARLDVDVETWAAFGDFQWTGSGAGTFETVFPAYRPYDLNASFDHAHNDYLELALEYGMVGVLPFIVLLVSAIIRSLQIQRRRRHPLLRGTGFAGFMALVAMSIHSVVDFNLQIPANAAYLVLIIAMIWIAGSLELKSKELVHNRKQLYY